MTQSETNSTRLLRLLETFTSIDNRQICRTLGMFSSNAHELVQRLIREDKVEVVGKMKTGTRYPTVRYRKRN